MVELGAWLYILRTWYCSELAHERSSVRLEIETACFTALLFFSRPRFRQEITTSNGTVIANRQITYKSAEITRE